MHFAINHAVRGTRPGSRAQRVPAILLLAALTLTACTNTASTSVHTTTAPSSSGNTAQNPRPQPTSSVAPLPDSDGGAAAVISSLGAVPIPTAPAADPTPTATSGHPQLLAIGAPVTAKLPGGVDALVTALGPDQLSTAPLSGGRPPQSTIGVITITAHATRGTITLRAADFSSRDETGQPIALTARGAPIATATPGHTATVQIKGRFSSGAAQITWTYQRSVISLWDFNIELD